MGPCQCRFAATAPRHHDRLLRAGADVAAAADLFELAVTWAELDYGDHELIPPADWLDFWSEHAWPDLDGAFRLFSVAVDAARASGGGPVPYAPADRSMRRSMAAEGVTLPLR